jgi:hypothetical protein
VTVKIKPLPKDLWLVGRDLENWKRNNPSAAEVWMNSFKPKK